MNPFITTVSTGLIPLGAAIWRFKRVHLLANLDISRVEWTQKDQVARYAGCFIMLLGAVFGVLAYFIEHAASARELTIFIACTIPVIMTLTVIYLAGLGRYMKK